MATGEVQGSGSGYLLASVGSLVGGAAGAFGGFGFATATSDSGGLETIPYYFFSGLFGFWIVASIGVWVALAAAGRPFATGTALMTAFLMIPMAVVLGVLAVWFDRYIGGTVFLFCGVCLVASALLARFVVIGHEADNPFETPPTQAG